MTLEQIIKKQTEIRYLYPYKSHPGIIHSDHTFNVTRRLIQSCENFNVNTKIYGISGIWHDIFKIYYKFKKHLDGEKVDYKDHGIPSAIIFFICFAYYKTNDGKNFSWLDGYKVMNIIANHHSALKPMFINDDNDNVVIFNKKDEIFKSVHDYETAINYLRLDFNSIFDKTGIDYINEFFELSYGYKVQPEKLSSFIKQCIFAKENCEQYSGEALYNKIFKSYIKEANKEWIQNPSKHSLHMRMGFSLLCESDRYIARQQSISPQNITIFNDKNLKTFNKKFEFNIKYQYISYSLKNLFVFNSKTKKLNELKNNAKSIAVKEIKNQLKSNSNNRVFQIVLNTGFGKTHLSALISSIIQKKFGYNFRTITTIPFRTLIEQTYKIYQKLIGNENIIQYMSASINYDKLDDDISNLDESDVDYSDKRNKIIGQEISYNTFDMPCIATTFVQFFELFDAKHSSDLLKLKNLSNSIFIIDEFQSLDKKEYIYYTSQLELFCEMFNSYAILMTATMPVLDSIETKNIVTLNDNDNIKKLNKIGCYNKKEIFPEIKFNEIFKNYYKPINLIPEKDIEYFFTNVNRYKITYLKEINNYIDLSEIIKQKIKTKNLKSILVVNNTIKCCENIYDLLKNDIPDFEILKITSELLPDDKNKIIRNFKYNVRKKIPTILCTTQVVECGMDISVDSVFSDNCPIANLIQRYGRGNRYFYTDIIDVYLYMLKDIDNIKFPNSYYCEYIYDNPISIYNLIKFDGVEEKELFYVQRKSFNDSFKIVEHGIFKGNRKHIKESTYNNLFFNIFSGLLKYHKIIPNRDLDAGKVLMYVKNDEKSDEEWNIFLSLYKKCQDENLNYEEKINIDKELTIKHKKLLRYCINVKNDVAFETYIIKDKEYDSIMLIKKLKTGVGATHKYVSLIGLVKL